MKNFLSNTAVCTVAVFVVIALLLVPYIKDAAEKSKKDEGDGSK